LIQSHAIETQKIATSLIELDDEPFDFINNKPSRSNGLDVDVDEQDEIPDTAEN